MQGAINVEELLPLVLGERSDSFLCSLVFFEVLTTTQATAERESTFRSISTRPWVQHSKRTILSFAVSDPSFSSNRLVVATVAEPLRTTAVEEGN